MKEIIKFYIYLQGQTNYNLMREGYIMQKKRNRLSELLDIPRELDKKQTKVTIISFEEILIENYKGIMEYEEFYVKINTELGLININGFNLNLEQMTNDDIIVKGVINSIDLERISE